MSELEQITVNASDEQNIKYLVEDLHAVYGNPYSIMLSNLPNSYKAQLIMIAEGLITYGWKKEEV